MSRSKDPLMYDDTWGAVLQAVKENKTPLVLRSSLKKAATLNLEWHCYRAAWKAESEKAEIAFLKGTRSPLAPEFSELRLRALENYRALCSYHSEVNRVLNQLVLRYRGGESTTLSIGDDEKQEQSSSRPFGLSHDPRPMEALQGFQALKEKTLSFPTVLINLPADFVYADLATQFPELLFHLDEFGQLWIQTK